MYKLTATLKNGVKFVTNSTKTSDLQRIAINLNAKRYQITLHGSVVVSSH